MKISKISMRLSREMCESGWCDPGIRARLLGTIIDRIEKRAVEEYILQKKKEEDERASPGLLVTVYRTPNPIQGQPAVIRIGCPKNQKELERDIIQGVRRQLEGCCIEQGDCVLLYIQRHIDGSFVMRNHL